MKTGIRWRFFVFTTKRKNRFDEPAEKYQWCISGVKSLRIERKGMWYHKRNEGDREVNPDLFKKNEKRDGKSNTLVRGKKRLIMLKLFRFKKCAGNQMSQINGHLSAVPFIAVVGL